MERRHGINGYVYVYAIDYVLHLLLEYVSLYIQPYLLFQYWDVLQKQLGYSTKCKNGKRQSGKLPLDFLLAEATRLATQHRRKLCMRHADLVTHRH